MGEPVWSARLKGVPSALTRPSSRGAGRGLSNLAGTAGDVSAGAVEAICPGDAGAAADVAAADVAAPDGAAPDGAAAAAAADGATADGVAGAAVAVAEPGVGAVVDVQATATMSSADRPVSMVAERRAVMACFSQGRVVASLVRRVMEATASVGQVAADPKGCPWQPPERGTGSSCWLAYPCRVARGTTKAASSHRTEGVHVQDGERAGA